MMLRLLLIVASFSSVLLGCGGSSADHSTKPNPDEKGGIQAKNRYAEGIYLLSMAEEAGDFIRGSNGYSQYLGVGFAVERFSSHEELQATVKQIGNASGDWYQISATANRFSLFDNQIKVNACPHKQQAQCNIEQSGIERGDTWLAPLSTIHQAQLQTNQLADNIEPLFAGQGFTVRVNDNPRLSALFIQTKARPLTAAFMTSLLPSQWQGPAVYNHPFDYNTYRFSREGVAPVQLTAAITDAQGNSHCIAVGQVSIKQGFMMHFDLEINASGRVDCQQYLQTHGATAELVQAIIGKQNIRIGFIEDAKGTETMAINHLTGLYPVGGAGLLTRKD
jgi:hypothetical protein